jgi:hypothetical protein
MRSLLLLLVAVCLLPVALAAQTTTGTIRGYVKDQNGTAVGGADITARNTETGVQRATTSRADGSFIFPGLSPATYELTVRNIGSSPQQRRVIVQIGSTLILDFALQAGAVELQAVTVVATPVIETRTSEVATNVTQQQINDLPTSSRNLFDLATLAPGIVSQPDRINSTQRNFVSGATCKQCVDDVNVFIDGVTYKNDLLRGGAVGQDRSRGNMFLRSAVQEFRVLTQNYKAEYQKASSGLLTATTRSGSNTFRGSAFISYQNQGLVALDTSRFATRTQAPRRFASRTTPAISWGCRAAGRSFPIGFTTSSRTKAITRTAPAGPASTSRPPACSRSSTPSISRSTTATSGRRSARRWSSAN